MTAPVNDNAEKILTAARNVDAVRCATVMHTAYVGDGGTTYSRQNLVALWGTQFPGEAHGVGAASLPNRVTRAMQLLSRTIMIIRDGQSYAIGNDEVLAWMAVRNSLVGMPGAQLLQISPADVERVNEMVAAHEQPVPDPGV
jgi:hypothetical protein